LSAEQVHVVDDMVRPAQMRDGADAAVEGRPHGAHGNLAKLRIATEAIGEEQHLRRHVVVRRVARHLRAGGVAEAVHLRHPQLGHRLLRPANDGLSDTGVRDIPVVLLQSVGQHPQHEVGFTAVARHAVAVAGDHLPVPATARRLALQSAFDDDAGGVEVVGVAGGAEGGHREQQVPAIVSAVGVVVVVEVSTAVVVGNLGGVAGRGGVTAEGEPVVEALRPGVAGGEASARDTVTLVLLGEVVAHMAHGVYPLTALARAVVAGIDVNGVPGRLLAEEVPLAVRGARELHQEGVVVVVLPVGPVHLALAELVAVVEHAVVPAGRLPTGVVVVDGLADFLVLRRTPRRGGQDLTEDLRTAVPLRRAGGDQGLLEECGGLPGIVTHRARMEVQHQLVLLLHPPLDLVLAAHQVVVELDLIELAASIVGALREVRAQIDDEPVLRGPEALGVELPEVAHGHGEAEGLTTGIDPSVGALEAGLALGLRGDGERVVAQLRQAQLALPAELLCFAHPDGPTPVLVGSQGDMQADLLEGGELGTLVVGTPGVVGADEA